MVGFSPKLPVTVFETFPFFYVFFSTRRCSMRGDVPSGGTVSLERTNFWAPDTPFFFYSFSPFPKSERVVGNGPSSFFSLVFWPFFPFVFSRTNRFSLPSRLEIEKHSKLTGAGLVAFFETSGLPAFPGAFFH